LFWSCSFWVNHSLLAAKPPITDLEFAPDGNRVVAVSQAGLQIFTWPKLTLHRTIDVDAANLHCVAFSPQGNLIAVGGGDPSEGGLIEVLSWPECERVALLRGHDDSVRSVVWQGSQHLVSGSMDRSITLWNVAGSTNEFSLRGHSRSVDAICLLQDDTTLVSTGVDQSLRVWDLSSRQPVRSLNQHTKPVHALALSPVETGLPMVASASADRTVRFWQPTIGRIVRYVRLESEPLAVAWTKDGKQLLATTVDGRVSIIDPTEVRVIRSAAVIDGWAYAIAIHPSEQAAVVAGTNGQIQRLDLNATRSKEKDRDGRK
jgi:WD40 repeat protein